MEAAILWVVHAISLTMSVFFFAVLIWLVLFVLKGAIDKFIYVFYLTPKTVVKDIQMTPEQREVFHYTVKVLDENKKLKEQLKGCTCRKCDYE